MTKKTYLLLNVQFIDGNGGEALQNAAVVIENGKIAWSGSVDTVPSPENAIKIDCTGMTVMPGIIEGHAHIGGGIGGVNVLRRSLQRGVTTACSVSANKAGIELRNAINEGKVRGCAGLVAGYTVTPTNGHVRFHDADGPWEVRRAVRKGVELGCDFIKTAASGGFWAENENCSVRNYTLEELVALADEIHAWDRPAVVHAHTQPGISNSVEAGIDMIHHGAFIDEAGVRDILAHDLWYMPTLRVTSERNIAAWPDRPWMMAEMRESSVIHRAGVKLAAELGVKLAVGSDYPGSSFGWAVGDAALWEMMELCECGVSPMDAIVAGTKTNAVAYRVLKKYGIGTLDVGMNADVLLLREDPLKDIKVLYEQKNLALVFKTGRVEYATGDFKQYYDIED